MQYSRNDILTKLSEMMKTNGITDKDLMSLPDDIRLDEDLGMTSINMLYMVIYIEEEFGVDFGAKSIRDFKTLGDVVKFISEEA